MKNKYWILLACLGLGMVARAEEAVKGETVDPVAQATVAEAASTTVETMPVPTFGPEGSRQNLISISLDDVPLQDVVRLFTRISGANIIATSTNLQGKVTVNLQDVEWKPALGSILDMYSMMIAEKIPGS
ncbi:MAG: hypothetical protein WCS01_15805, partial [bacterium]